ncbi:MAG: right-handed parallel beta-helix repeat-containing protein [Anaerolineales bacterium]|nr:right-handed parallel beta-helix repeat-containing protein [Anaerolineales bacterium]
MTLLLSFALCWPAVAQAEGAVIRVPDDAPTIQAAIDTAQPGDTIQVRFSDISIPYQENLSITKPITLSGGWDADFTEQTYGNSAIDGQGIGRVISITLADPAEVVTIEGFSIYGGDATGLGGTDNTVMDISAGAQWFNPGAMAPAEGAPVLAGAGASPSGLRSQLGALAAAGALPGGASAYQEMLAQLDWLDAQSAQRASSPVVAPAAAAADGIDCGGGIYSAGASLQLAHNWIEDNIASRTGEGAGGAVCIDGAAQGGVQVRLNYIQHNIASVIDMGTGGGIYLADAPGAQVVDNVLNQNIAASAGPGGIGGGLFVFQAPDLILQGNQFSANTALTSPNIEEPGIGGGAYIRASDDITIANNQFKRNLAALYTGGIGGAVYLYQLTDATIQDNQFTANWGAMYQNALVLAGAVGLGDVNHLSLSGNTFTENIAGLDLMARGTALGGAVFAATVSDIQIHANTFLSNVVALSLVGYGGAIAVDTSKTGPSTNVMVTENTFTGNGATLAEGDCHGGAIRLTAIGATVQDNTFTANGCHSTTDFGMGGALLVEGAMESSVVSSGDVTVDGNYFFSNVAEGGGQGGALAIRSTENFTVTNNVLAHNRADAGGAMAVMMGFPTSDDANGHIVNNTLVDNGETGLYADYWNTLPGQVINNVFVSQTIAITVGERGLLHAAYNLFNGDYLAADGSGEITLTHSVSGSVRFEDPDNDNYALSFLSAAIDAGDPAGVPPAPAIDIDGFPRPFGAAVDIGAYEWYGGRVFMPDIESSVCRTAVCIGWAVGDSAPGPDGKKYGVILHTTDGGGTWTRQGKAGEIPDMDLHSVSAIDAENAWVAGQQGILRTRDGGQTWEQQALPAGVDVNGLYGIKAIDGNHAWAVGAIDMLLETIDGSTWHTMPVSAGMPTHQQWSDVDALDAQHVWASGGDMDRTTPPTIGFYDGVRWSVQGSGVITGSEISAWIGISAVDTYTVWSVGGISAPMFKTTNGGATWNLVGPVMAAGGDLNRVVAVTDLMGWADGDFGSINRTDDGGVTWKRQFTGLDSYLYTITAANDKQAWAVGPGRMGTPPGYLLRTVDGHNWEVRAAPVAGNLWGISFVGARR